MSEVKNRRVTITKNLVGQVKTSAYVLPDNDFVYGIESKLDPEGAGNGKRADLHVLSTNRSNSLIHSTVLLPQPFSHDKLGSNRTKQTTMLHAILPGI